MGLQSLIFSIILVRKTSPVKCIKLLAYFECTEQEILLIHNIIIIRILEYSHSSWGGRADI